MYLPSNDDNAGKHFPKSWEVCIFLTSSVPKERASTLKPVDQLQHLIHDCCSELCSLSGLCSAAVGAGSTLHVSTAIEGASHSRHTRGKRRSSTLPMMQTADQGNLRAMTQVQGAPSVNQALQRLICRQTQRTAEKLQCLSNLLQVDGFVLSSWKLLDYFASNSASHNWSDFAIDSSHFDRFNMAPFKHARLV